MARSGKATISIPNKCRWERVVDKEKDRVRQLKDIGQELILVEIHKYTRKVYLSLCFSLRNFLMPCLRCKVKKPHCNESELEYMNIKDLHLNTYKYHIKVSKFTDIYTNSLWYAVKAYIRKYI